MYSKKRRCVDHVCTVVAVGTTALRGRKLAVLPTYQVLFFLGKYINTHVCTEHVRHRKMEKPVVQAAVAKYGTYGNTTTRKLKSRKSGGIARTESLSWAIGHTLEQGCLFHANTYIASPTLQLFQVSTVSMPRSNWQGRGRKKGVEAGDTIGSSYLISCRMRMDDSVETPATRERLQKKSRL